MTAFVGQSLLGLAVRKPAGGWATWHPLQTGNTTWYQYIGVTGLPRFLAHGPVLYCYTVLTYSKYMVCISSGEVRILAKARHETTLEKHVYVAIRFDGPGSHARATKVVYHGGNTILHPAYERPESSHWSHIPRPSMKRAACYIRTQTGHRM